MAQQQTENGGLGGCGISRKGMKRKWHVLCQFQHIIFTKPKKGHTRRAFNCVVLCFIEWICVRVEWFQIMSSSHSPSSNRNNLDRIKYESKWAWSGYHFENHVWKLERNFASFAFDRWITWAWARACSNTNIHLFQSVAIKIIWFVSLFLLRSFITK